MTVWDFPMSVLQKQQNTFVTFELESRWMNLKTIRFYRFWQTNCTSMALPFVSIGNRAAHNPDTKAANVNTRSPKVGCELSKIYGSRNQLKFYDLLIQNINYEVSGKSWYLRIIHYYIPINISFFFLLEKQKEKQLLQIFQLRTKPTHPLFWTVWDRPIISGWNQRKIFSTKNNHCKVANLAQKI